MAHGVSGAGPRTCSPVLSPASRASASSRPPGLSMSRARRPTRLRHSNLSTGQDHDVRGAGRHLGEDTHEPTGTAARGGSPSCLAWGQGPRTALLLHSSPHPGPAPLPRVPECEKAGPGAASGGGVGGSQAAAPAGGTGTLSPTLCSMLERACCGSQRPRPHAAMSSHPSPAQPAMGGPR